MELGEIFPSYAVSNSSSPSGRKEANSASMCCVCKSTGKSPRYLARIAASSSEEQRCSQIARRASSSALLALLYAVSASEWSANASSRRATQNAFLASRTARACSPSAGERADIVAVFLSSAAKSRSISSAISPFL
jgi:hypothetical protein